MSGAPNNIWGALAQRGMDDEPADDFARPSIQRTVDAATAPPIAPPGAVASPFSHPYVAGNTATTSTAADDEADAATPPPPPPPAGEAPMPKPSAAKARKPQPTRAASPQFQICSLLMAKGELSRDDLAADVSCDRRPLENALYNAKAAGRIVWVEKLDKYRITKEGREWASGGANLGNQRKAAQAEPPPPKATAPRPQKAAPAAVTTLALVPAAQPAQVTVVERSFRCAVYSDGSFHLQKAGQAIDLTAAEHAEMLRYLERMDEQQA